VSVNKAVVTQSSAAIPVVPLYISILFKEMQSRGLHEGCIEQMLRLFKKGCVQMVNVCHRDLMYELSTLALRSICACVYPLTRV
jgi:trans-2-enoyl-CoA reductase